jgi:hypothetical protein
VLLSKSNFWGKARFFLQVLLLLVAPVVGAAEEIPERDGLRARAEARWQALIAGDFDKAYDFETPAYRKLYNVRQYRARYSKGLRWNQAKIVEIDPRQPEVATVKVEIDYSFPVSDQGMMDAKGLSTETWLWVDEQWWYHGPELAASAGNPKS